MILTSRSQHIILMLTHYQMMTLHSFFTSLNEQFSENSCGTCEVPSAEHKRTTTASRLFCRCLQLRRSNKQAKRASSTISIEFFGI